MFVVAKGNLVDYSCCALPSRGDAPVAQLDRVADYESAGHEFESCLARQENQGQGSFLGLFANWIMMDQSRLPSPNGSSQLHGEREKRGNRQSIRAQKIEEIK